MWSILARRTAGISLAIAGTFAATMTGADAHGLSPNYACAAGGPYFDINAPIVSVRYQVGKTFSNYNSSNSIQPATFTETQAATVGTTYTSSGTLEVGVLFDKVSASVSVALEHSNTVTTGDNQGLNIPGKKWGLARFGVPEEQTSGTYYRVNSACQRYDVVTVSKVDVPENTQGWIVEIKNTDSW
jgi:hypothetical protein